MTYRESGERRTAHRPQHAAKPGFTGPMPSSPLRVPGGRLHTRQPGRDAIAAAAWVTVLCLAVATITITASLAGRDRGTVATHRSTPSLRRVTPAISKQPSARVLASFKGNGNQTTKPFTAVSGGRLQLRWAYRCPASQHKGEFIVAGASDTPGQVFARADVRESALSGNGRTWLTADGRHALVVTSTCTWTMRVVWALPDSDSAPPPVASRARVRDHHRARLDRTWLRRWLRDHSPDWSRFRDHSPDSSWFRRSGHWPWFGSGYWRSPDGQHTAWSDG